MWIILKTMDYADYTTVVERLGYREVESGHDIKDYGIRYTMIDDQNDRQAGLCSRPK